MRAYVFKDAALTKQAGRFVWLSIDTEQASSALFVERYEIQSWPTLFVLDPVTEAPVIKWAGSADVAQLGRLLDDGEGAVRRRWAGSEEASLTPHRGSEGDPQAALAAADALDAQGDHAAAAKAYLALLDRVSADWPGRGRVVESCVFAQYGAGDFEGCARTAREQAAGLPHGSYRFNAIGGALACVQEAPPDALWRKASLATLEGLANASLDEPGILADDRSSLYEVLVEARKEAKDPAGARTLAQQWWDFLAANTALATTPQGRATFDAHRVLAAIALGDAGRAIPGLEASERDLPADFNPPARLARVYLELHRYDDALAANGRALAKVYGPRKLRLLQQQGTILSAKGDRKASRAALETALAEAKKLPQTVPLEVEVKQIRQTLEGL